MRRLLVHRWLFRKLRRNDGQAAFEFLLIFPALVVFLLLLTDLGVMMYEFVSVSNAVREGARYAAVNCGDLNCVGGPTPETPAQRTVNRSSGFLTSGEVTVQWTGINRGDAVVVHALHPYDFLFFPGFSIDVKSCSEMRLEQRDNGSITATASATC
jgi:hypothetical protein